SGDVAVTGSDLLQLITRARAFLAGKNLRRGDRCALLAPNSIQWVAMDLAIMAEGLIVLSLYLRQAGPELAAMSNDWSPSLIVCGDAALRDVIAQSWPEAPQQVLFDEAFIEGTISRPREAAPHHHSDPVAIIYTSGTSGEAKGVILNS